MSSYGNYPNKQLCNTYGCYYKLTGIVMCVGCLPTEKERQETIAKLTKEVKEYAIKFKKNYILFDPPDGNIGFMEAEAAKAAGLRPFKFISHFVPDANDGIS